MPTLNAARFLKKSIESILAQTIDTWELIVVDGGSSDGTQDILEMYVKADTRIKLIKLPEKGMYAAITNGFYEATGDIFAWLSADDLYPPWAFASVQMSMNRPSVEWITGRPAIFDENDVMRCIYPHIPFTQFLIRKGFCHGGGIGCIQAESTFFTSKLYSALTPEQIEDIQNMELAGDFLLWRYFAKHAHLHKVPTVIGGFRLHCKNRSVTERNSYQTEVLKTQAWRLPRFVACICQRLAGTLSGAISYEAAIKENSTLNKTIAFKSKNNDDDTKI